MEEDCAELVPIINVIVGKEYTELKKEIDYLKQSRELKKALMTPHPLTNLEIQDYYRNEPRCNGVYSRDNLPKTIKNDACVINLDEYTDIGTHWIA